MLERLKNEPAVLILVAAAVVVVGVDLTVISQTVEQLIQLFTLAASAYGLRRQVTPVGNPHDNEGNRLTPAGE